jgi:hypothetical protein
MTCHKLRQLVEGYRTVRPRVVLCFCMPSPAGTVPISKLCQGLERGLPIREIVVAGCVCKKGCDVVPSSMRDTFYQQLKKAKDLVFVRLGSPSIMHFW